MPYLKPREAIEQFHLLFLDQFGRKIDKRLYALKGGCNLRFYYKSIRYSEDLDLDVQIVSVETLRHKVCQILKSKPFQQILLARGLLIEKFSEPKQTPTTQRWKISLRERASNICLNTKVEFSRRGLIGERVKFESIDPEIIQLYQLNPILVNHYLIAEAFRQKLAALLGRNQTQARDLFDLYLLIQRGASIDLLDDAQLKQRLFEAKTKAMEISFEDFKGQVLAYLPAHYQSQYDHESVWEDLIFSVTNALDDSS